MGTEGRKGAERGQAAEGWALLCGLWAWVSGGQVGLDQKPGGQWGYSSNSRGTEAESGLGSGSGNGKTTKDEHK